MKRFGQLMLAISVAAVGLTGTARAQSSAPEKMSAEFTVGPTFGNKAGVSFGGEFDYKLGTEWEAFFEVGQMSNVAAPFVDDAAQVVAATIGGSADVKDQATYYNVGLKYLFVPFGGGYLPYVGLGLGAAHVKKDTTFSVNGAELSEQQLLDQYGVQLGADLAGLTTKPMMVIAAGVSRNFMQRYFLDLSYRYGLIFSGDTIEDDHAINTNRLQFGVGIRF